MNLFKYTLLRFVIYFSWKYKKESADLKETPPGKILLVRCVEIGASFPRRNKLLWSSLIHKTSARHERQERNTSATQVRREWKTLVLITTLVKTYFHTLIFTIWQVKDYKKRNNFILRSTIWKYLVSMQNAFKKCATKTILMQKVCQRVAH